MQQPKLRILRYKKQWALACLKLAALILCLVLFAKPFSVLPPLSNLLSPFQGLWIRKSPGFEAKTESTTKSIQGLKGKVEIHVDNDQIKHIFAENDDDLYFAQGWLMASERLWQMEFITRAASGRLSEVLGREALPIDRYFRKLGLGEAARLSAEMMNNDPVTGPAVKAYVSGVNAYLDQLKDSELPFEYKLLNYRPERWDTTRPALLLKFMAYNLAGFSQDIELTRSMGMLSPADFEDLYSLKLRARDPIVPKGTAWNFPSRTKDAPQASFQVDLRSLENIPRPNPANGSNNWAIAGKKSTTGLPILSNDIHLGLQLPAIVYEIQLVSPTQNVYGVTFPGAPGVILGFNKNVAWAVTNGGTDVMDWYELRYRDEKKSEYLFDGGWRPVLSRKIDIKVRAEEKPESILIRQTHIGPVIFDESEIPAETRIPHGLSMRWGALEASNELKTFMMLNRAQTTSECRSAIDTYDTPDQNFICADNKDDIGLWHMGKYPVRWAGQGRTIGDGSSSEYDWAGWIPREELPFSRNPSRGFVSSANQNPTDDEYPHYLGWPFESPFRGERINEILKSKNKFSPQDMIKMQTDSLSITARETLPAMLKALPKTDDEREKKIRELLSTWDFRFEEDSVAATIYSVWYRTLISTVWERRLPDSKGDHMNPPPMRNVILVTDEPDSKWFDNPETDEKENLGDVASETLKLAVAQIADRMNSSNPDSWLWRIYRPTNFEHMGRIPGLGQYNFAAGGSADAIFANHGEHGPVWKLVVALGAKKPRAWAIYPGGQSGDPRSRHYDNFLGPWRRGEMKEVSYLLKPSDENSRLQTKVILSRGEEK